MSLLLEGTTKCHFALFSKLPDNMAHFLWMNFIINKDGLFNITRTNLLFAKVIDDMFRIIVSYIDIDNHVCLECFEFHPRSGKHFMLYGGAGKILDTDENLNIIMLQQGFKK